MKFIFLFRWERKWRIWGRSREFSSCWKISAGL